MFEELYLSDNYLNSKESLLIFIPTLLVWRVAKCIPYLPDYKSHILF